MVGDPCGPGTSAACGNPGMAWESKESFRVVASYFAAAG
jgi:hypothetical protein